MQIIDKVCQTDIKGKNSQSVRHRQLQFEAEYLREDLTSNMTEDYFKKDKKKLSWKISDREKNKSCLRRQSQITWRDIK